MHYLVNGIVATGTDTFHPGQSPDPTDDDDIYGSDTGDNGGNPATTSATSSATLLENIFIIIVDRHLPQHRDHLPLAKESVLRQNPNL
jgi:hypothetical protein